MKGKLKTTTRSSIHQKHEKWHHNDEKTKDNQNFRADKGNGTHNDDDNTDEAMPSYTEQGEKQCCFQQPPCKGPVSRISPWSFARNWILRRQYRGVVWRESICGPTFALLLFVDQDKPCIPGKTHVMIPVFRAIALTKT